jgi:hypothetical protein
MKRLLPLFSLFLLAPLTAQEATEAICSEQSFRFYSEILRSERNISLSIPEKKAPSPVFILINSGPGNFRTAILKNEFFVINIESPDPKTDFGDPSGRDQYYHFLISELIPFITNTYAVAPEIFISGHSQAGAFVMEAFCRDPGLFTFVILTSPALHILGPIPEECLLPPKLTGLSITTGDRENYPQLSEACEILHKDLKKLPGNNLKWNYEVLGNETHETNFYTGFCRGYSFFRSLISIPDSLMGADFDSILDYAGRIEKNFGFRPAIDEYIVMPNILINLQSGNGGRVVKAISYMAENLPGLLSGEQELILEIANELESQGKQDSAIEICSILHNLTGNKEAKSKIKELRKEW